MNGAITNNGGAAGTPGRSTRGRGRRVRGHDDNGNDRRGRCRYSRAPTCVVGTIAHFGYRTVAETLHDTVSSMVATHSCR